MYNENEKGGVRALHSGSHQLFHPAVPGSNPSEVSHSTFLGVRLPSRKKWKVKKLFDF